MLTSLLVVGKLRAEKIEVDLAGFLTPWSLHYFNGKLEKPINRLIGQKAKKFIPTKEKHKLPFFEPYLFKINGNNALGIGKMYLFSLQYGTNKLKRGVQKIVSANKYDLIIAVDVGGDVLARKADIGTVITPIVDFSCINILNDIKTRAKKYLAVISPGVDGELSKQSLKEIIYGYKNKGQIFQTEILKKEDQTNYIFLDTLEKINKRTRYYSHTTEMIKKILLSKATNKERYVKTLKVHDKKWPIKYSVSLDPGLSNKIYYFELEKICNKMPVRPDYVNILQAFKLFKKAGVGGTEVDLTYIPGKIRNEKYTNCIFIQNIIYRASCKQREEINEYISKHVPEKNLLR
ncbi:MAG: DUF1152 domain-containing protein [Candidatus Magasanikbacteria bacterium]|nr:DUF1152 domain-containing protein [Candidatus Magasanikbacteria bacterium]